MRETCLTFLRKQAETISTIMVRWRCTGRGVATTRSVNQSDCEKATKKICGNYSSAFFDKNSFKRRMASQNPVNSFCREDVRHDCAVVEDSWKEGSNLILLLKLSLWNNYFFLRRNSVQSRCPVQTAL